MPEAKLFTRADFDEQVVRSWIQIAGPFPGQRRPVTIREWAAWLLFDEAEDARWVMLEEVPDERMVRLTVSLPLYEEYQLAFRLARLYEFVEKHREVGMLWHVTLDRPVRREETS